MELEALSRIFEKEKDISNEVQNLWSRSFYGAEDDGYSPYCDIKVEGTWQT